MIYSDLYAAALRLISETEDSITTDYEERAPYLLGTFVSEQIALQKKWQITHGETPETIPVTLCVEMSEDFPLAEPFIAPATYYLAAMLVLDENETLYEHLFDKYADGIANLEASLPASSEKIKDRYPGSI